METTLQIRRVPLTGLHLDASNARQHGERNLEAIKASLARFQQVEPLVVQKSTGRVIGGNGRLVAMRALGWTEADVVELDLTDTQATGLGIALNRTGELAEWDLPTLGRLLEGLQSDGALDGVGYTDAELREVLDAVIALNPIETSEDDVPALPDEASTKTGDLWVMGRHRLLCGDSSKPEDVDRLLAGAPIHLVNMDPVVSKNPARGLRTRRMGGL